ncbi:MAG TPA: Asp-tRNA(Asn)/Glu-tRNA(Gln) amidotransferase GatCAB subunit B, partial [Planctomycetaceae bacterium]|nr:Asp-tRNA(Asn)/Glu-tRNA(Gln) amidotransferase GatCAB subunit B [Planctomycetaceae bacterium]
AISIEAFPIGPDVLAAVLRKINAGALTVKSGREVFKELLALADAGTPPTAEWIDRIIAEKDLAVVSDTAQLDAAIAQALAGNPKAVEDFRSGKQAAIGKLIGDVMREVKGADAKVVRQMIVERMSDVQESA